MGTSGSAERGDRVVANVRSGWLGTSVPTGRGTWFAVRLCWGWARASDGECECVCVEDPHPYPLPGGEGVREDPHPYPLPGGEGVRSWASSRLISLYAGRPGGGVAGGWLDAEPEIERTDLFYFRLRGTHERGQDCARRDGTDGRSWQISQTARCPRPTAPHRRSGRCAPPD